MFKNISIISVLIFCINFTSTAVDGISVSYHSDYTDPAGLHSGILMRHIIQSDTVSGDTIFFNENIRRACLSPDGTRISFIRVSDGMLCVMKITGGTIHELTTISPDASVDWPDSVWIYYTYLFNHVTLKRINTFTRQVQDVGWFPKGAVNISVSGIHDSLRNDLREKDSLWGDVIRGTAVLDSGGGEYRVTTFDYKVFQIIRTAGCVSHISPSGGLFSVGGCRGDTASYRRRLDIFKWDGSPVGLLTAPDGEYFSRGSWAVNSDDWFVATVGRDRELLLYHDMAIISRTTPVVVRVTQNDTGSYNEACDFWSGNPDYAMSRSAVISLGVSQWGMPDYKLLSGEINTITIETARIYSLQGKLVRNNQSAAFSSGVYLLKNGNRIMAKYHSQRQAGQ